MYIDKEICYKENWLTRLRRLRSPKICGQQLETRDTHGVSSGPNPKAGEGGCPSWRSQAQSNLPSLPFVFWVGQRSSVGWMRSPTLGRTPSSLSPSNLMLVSPRNTLTDAPRALLNQASGSCGPITWTQSYPPCIMHHAHYDYSDYYCCYY